MKQNKEICFLKEVKVLIQEKKANTLFDVSELADQLQLSKAQLNRKIKKHTGSSLGKLILYYRMELAIELLGSSRHSIEEIAYKCGFSGTPNFSRKFKQEFNASPSVFRKKLLSSDLELNRWKVPLDEEGIIQLIDLSRKHYWLNQLLAIIINNGNNKITVSNLSKLLFMDSSTLNSKVNDLLGMSAKRLVLDLELDFAAKMLKIHY